MGEEELKVVMDVGSLVDYCGGGVWVLKGDFGNGKGVWNGGGELLGIGREFSGEGEEKVGDRVLKRIGEGYCLSVVWEGKVKGGKRL